MKRRVFVMLIILLFATACGKEKTEEEKIAEAIKSVIQTENSKKEANTTEDKLFEINNFITNDIWNKGFVDVQWYITNGTSSTGGELDIDFTMERLDKAVAKKNEYDVYFESLSDEKYTSIKQVWDKLSGEIDRLHEQLKNRPPVANDKDADFQLGKFKQYREAFDDEVDNLRKQ